ncbi:unnamed protein product [Alopecurus aequalis]
MGYSDRLHSSAAARRLLLLPRFRRPHRLPQSCRTHNQEQTFSRSRDTEAREP